MVLILEANLVVRCSNFRDLRGLLREFTHLYSIRRIQVVWDGFDLGGAFLQLATLATSLVELRLVFDERKDKAILARLAWKILLKTIREKKWQVHLDGEAQWLHKGGQ